MVDDWARVRQEQPGARVVMLTDSSNDELDRLNKLAQDRRAAAGELGHRRARLPDRPYDLAAGDEVILTGQLRQPGEERVENGTRGTVQSVDERANRVVMRTDEPQPQGRRVLDPRVPRRSPRVRAARLQGAGPHDRPGPGA